MMTSGRRPAWPWLAEMWFTRDASAALPSFGVATVVKPCIPSPCAHVEAG